MSVEILGGLFILYGVYCAINLKNDYATYKENKSYVDFNIYIRNLGVVIGSIIIFFYLLSN